MKEAVSAYISQNRMLTTDKPVLVALSGGADSVALLCVLRELNFPIIALHCNFHLRGNESDWDEAFVTKLCQRFHVELHIRHFDTRLYAQKHQASIEMAARDLRYGWFQEMIRETNAQAVAVAHHQDDQAETVLLNLLRGTGIRGLCGMHPIQGHIVRPLLCTNRNAILRYLESVGETYVTDSTNMERDALRNRIRLDVLPMLCELNPKISALLAQTANHAREELVYFQKGIEQEGKEKGIQKDILCTEALHSCLCPATMLHEWLRGYGFNAAQEQEMLEIPNGTSGQLWTSSSHRLLHDRGRLLLRPIEFHTEPPVLTVTTVPEMGEFSPMIAYADADKLTLPLTVRKVRPNDRFVPFGMKGSRLLSDFMTDQKMSLFEKEDQYVACSGEDIVWAIGRRADNRFRVTSHTQKIVRLALKQKLV